MSNKDSKESEWGKAEKVKASLLAFVMIGNQSN